MKYELKNILLRYQLMIVIYRQYQLVAIDGIILNKIIWCSIAYWLFRRN